MWCFGVSCWRLGVSTPFLFGAPTARNITTVGPVLLLKFFVPRAFVFRDPEPGRRLMHLWREGLSKRKRLPPKVVKHRLRGGITSYPFRLSTLILTFDKPCHEVTNSQPGPMFFHLAEDARDKGRRVLILWSVFSGQGTYPTYDS